MLPKTLIGDRSESVGLLGIGVSFMKIDATERQIVSKQRVADHGEVLTSKREVNAMLDLVKR